jgi:hypothetical protein
MDDRFVTRRQEKGSEVIVDGDINKHDKKGNIVGVHQVKIVVSYPYKK